MWTGRLSQYLSGPPGPKMQQLNALLHEEPYSTLLYAFYWTMVLVFGAPFVGIGLLYLTLYELFRQFVFKRRRIEPKSKKDELAVVVTGCDTGIGKQLAYRLASEGFIVFAGCLKTESIQSFIDSSKTNKAGAWIIPVSLDVTSEKQVQEVYTIVRKWLDHNDYDSKDKKKNKRYLHALVNNAGIGRIGYVDWASISDYQACMDVNCFGMIRMVKAFLPIFKSQATTRECSYTDAQILNIISMAGMLSGGGLGFSAYEVSKNAAEAFSNGLRLEMKMFGIKVVSVNPSFHTTPLVDDVEEKINKTVWEKLSDEKRNEYGQDFFKKYVKHVKTMMTVKQWDPMVIVDSMVNAIQSSEPPAQILIGTDAKYSMITMSMFPQWFRHYIVQASLPEQLPNIVKEKFKKE